MPPSTFASKKLTAITLLSILSIGPTFCVVDHLVDVTYIQQDATDDPAVVEGLKDNQKAIDRIRDMRERN